MTSSRGIMIFCHDDRGLRRGKKIVVFHDPLLWVMDALLRESSRFRIMYKVEFVNFGRDDDGLWPREMALVLSCYS